MRPVVEQWVKEDAQAASAWITTLPRGEERDDAAMKLAGAIQRRDPASSFEWARSIQNELHRARTIEEVMDQWKLQDPEAAMTAADSLPPELRKLFKEQK